LWKFPQKGKIQSLSGEYSGVDVKKTNFGSVFNGTNLPFKSALFDIVLLNEVIYAILDGPKAISECYRVLKPGGTLIVSANFLYPLQGDPTQFELGFAKDHFRFTESGLKELLSLHFKKITVDQLGGLGSQLLLPQYFYRNHLMRHPNKAVKFVFTFLFPAFLVACATLNLLGILLNSLDSSKLFATDVVAIAKK
jgi:SAM-dependent methyltransferase